MQLNWKIRIWFLSSLSTQKREFHSVGSELSHFHIFDFMNLYGFEIFLSFQVLNKNEILEPQIESWVETDTQVRKGDLQWGYDRLI